MTSDELLLMVLESVANDYEQLGQIAEQVAMWTNTPPGRLDLERIRAALVDAVNRGYIEVYEFHSTTRHPLKVALSTGALEERWFLITEKGKARCAEAFE